MTTVLCGTNRTGSNSSIVASYITQQAKLRDEVQYLSLEDVDWSEVVETMYTPDDHPESFRAIDEQYMIGADRWIIVSPEYNGSMPGILKLFIDAISTHRYGDTFGNKKAMLFGVASGRAGNLRGMEQITGYLNYLKVHVHPQKLPISSIKSVLSADGELNDPTQEAIEQHLSAFYSF